MSRLASLTSFAIALACLAIASGCARCTWLDPHPPEVYRQIYEESERRQKDLNEEEREQLLRTHGGLI